MKKSLKKIIVIVGPTAAGKSDLAIALARQYQGEIISADSRQVYRGMNIGTGKVTKTEQRLAKHWLLDVASPKRNYNVTHFVRDARRAIADIKRCGKTVIICGGTGFWVQALLENTAFPAVTPNPSLRKKFAQLSAEALFLLLRKQDQVRANSIDPKNKARLIRALEICAAIGTVPALPVSQPLNTTDSLIIALNPAKETLWGNIETRLEKRLKKGMLAEVKKLRASGLSWKKLESFGLEYRYSALFLQEKITRTQLKEQLNFAIRHYAKRQITWLKRWEKMGAPIHWVTHPQAAEKIITKEH